MRLYLIPGYGLAYRTISRVLHYFDLHYAPLSHPIMPDGDRQRWCQWCGFRMNVPNERRIKAELNAAAYGIDAARDRQENK